MFFSMIGELDFPDELFGGSQLFEENHDYDENRYDAAKRELSDTGENYSAVLDEGTYIVGVHIPEGSYTIEEGQKDTYDGFYLEDSENGIYISESFRKEEEQETVEDIRCYTGAKVSVRGKMTFSSENAQTADIIALDNPLTESVRAADGDIAGEDFPAGTYDVVMSEGDTSFAYVVPGTVLEDPEADYEGVTERIWINTHDGEFVKRNIYLPQGTKVLVEKGKVNLVPSEKIPESYEGYYYIYEEK